VLGLMLQHGQLLQDRIVVGASVGIVCQSMPFGWGEDVIQIISLSERSHGLKVGQKQVEFQRVAEYFYPDHFTDHPSTPSHPQHNFPP
jgi:hypothetical protein